MLFWDTISDAHSRGRLVEEVRWPNTNGKLLSQEEWVDKVMSSKNYRLCKKTFAKSIGIDSTSFSRYTRNDRRKRTSLGTRLGRPPKSKATLEMAAALQSFNIMSSLYDIRQGGTTALQIAGEERRQRKIGWYGFKDTSCNIVLPTLSTEQQTKELYQMKVISEKDPESFACIAPDLMGRGDGELTTEECMSQQNEEKIKRLPC